MPTYIRDAEMLIGGNIYVEQLRIKKDGGHFDKETAVNLIEDGKKQEALRIETMSKPMSFQAFVCIFIILVILGMGLACIFWPSTIRKKQVNSDDLTDVETANRLPKNTIFY